MDKLGAGTLLLKNTDGSHQARERLITPSLSVSPRSCIDREAFQTMLASAFVVQESGIDTDWLSALIQVQRSIESHELDKARTMQLIADHALEAANAAGIAIALLKAGQLVYQAGSGSATSSVGRHITAVMQVSAQNEETKEILRVENAQADSRVEAAICRQFGAGSLLILPICMKHTLVGVMEVFFREAHTFQDREVRAYRLMAKLIEEVTSRIDSKTISTIRAATLPTFGPVASHNRQVRVSTNCVAEAVGDHRIFLDREMFPAAAGKVTASSRTKAATATIKPNKCAFINNVLINVIPIAVLITIAMLIALAVAVWTAYEHHRPLSVAVAKTSRANDDGEMTSKLLAAHSSRNTLPVERRTKDRGFHNSAFTRVRVSPSEVDYATEDVTIRYFTPFETQQRSSFNKQVDLRDDVTVRYFAYTPAVPLTQPVPVGVPPQQRSLPGSK